MLLAIGFYRIVLIKTIANWWLTDSQVYIERIDGLHLGWERSAIEHIQLRMGNNNALQLIDDLSVDYSLRSLSLNNIQVKRAALAIPEFNDSEPLLVSEMIQEILILPIEKFDIHALKLDVVPEVLRFDFEKMPQGVRAQLTGDSHTVTVEIKQYLKVHTDLSFELANRQQTFASLKAQLKPDSAGYRLDGELGVVLQGFWGLLDELQISLPGHLSYLTGLLDMKLSAKIPNAIEQALLDGVAMHAEIAEPISVEYKNNHATVLGRLQLELPVGADLIVIDKQGIQLDFGSETVMLKLESQTNELLVDGSFRKFHCFWHDQINCETGLVIEAEMSRLDLDSIVVKSPKSKVNGAFFLKSGMAQINLLPGSQMSADGLIFSDLGIDKLELQLLEAARLSYSLDSEDLEFDVEKVKLRASQKNTEYQVQTGAELSGSGAVRNKQLSATVNLDGTLNRASYADFKLPQLKVQTEVKLNEGQIDMSGAFQTHTGVALFAYEMGHKLDEETGRASFWSADIDFSEQQLSDYFNNWEFNLDLLSGSMEMKAQFDWSLSGQDPAIKGEIRHRATGLAGYFHDVAFVGLSGNIGAKTQGLSEVRSSAPGSVKIEMLDIGLPIRNVVLSYSFDTLDQRLDIHSFQAAMLSGKVSFKDYSYYISDKESSQNQVLNLNIDALDIAELLKKADYEAVMATGRLSGKLPIKVTTEGMSIDSGELTALAPGGIIRYEADSAEPGLNSAVKLVREALNNYHYDQMKLVAHYSPKGDLQLDVRMKGMNPDMNQGQKINLNVNISDNIPMLLKSLQSSRVVTDILNNKLLKISK